MARILIVDDEAGIRETLKQIIEMEGHAADMAVDGSQAIKMIRQQNYDLVIMDRNMPIMSGIDALRIIRTAPKYKDLKVIMLTSASVTKEIDEAFSSGASGYILKPLNIEQFIAKIKTLLENEK